MLVAAYEDQPPFSSFIRQQKVDSTSPTNHLLKSVSGREEHFTDLKVLPAHLDPPLRSVPGSRPLIQTLRSEECQGESSPDATEEPVDARTSSTNPPKVTGAFPHILAHHTISQALTVENNSCISSPGHNFAWC